MQFDKKFLRYAFFLLAGGLFLYWIILDTERLKLFLGEIWDIMTPFVLGSAIAFIFNIPMRFMERQMKWVPNQNLRRILAMLITLVTFIFIIAFVFLLLIPQIRITVDALVETLPEFIFRESQNVVNFLEMHPQVQNFLMEEIGLSSVDWSTVLERLLGYLGNRFSGIFDSAFSAIGSVTSGIVNTLLGICFALYALVSKESLVRQGRKLLYTLLSEAHADEIIRVLRLSNVTFSNFFSGQCLEGLILGLLFAVSMTILGLPFMPLVSVIIAITSLVPYVGAFVGCVLGALFILVESPMEAVTFLIMFLVLQQIEGNLIYPRVVGTSIGLPAIWVLVALTVGGEVAGITGMFIMIPLASVCYTLTREYANKKLAEKNIPEEKLRMQPLEFKSKFQENRQRRKQARLLRRMKNMAERHAKKLARASKKSKED